MLKKICAQCGTQECCQIANDNGGGQLVISGAKGAVEKAAQMATEKGAKRAIILPVSAPFHSALMQPAAVAMQEALENVEMRAPVVPLIANVLATPISDPGQIRQHLVEQVTGQVRWRETIEFMAGQWRYPCNGNRIGQSIDWSGSPYFARH